MANGDLSKRVGVQPDSAMNKVLSILAEHDELSTKELDAKSPYDSPVYSREARAAIAKGMVKKNFDSQSGYVTFSITEVGKAVLADLTAYRDEYAGRKVVTYYRKAFKNTFDTLKDNGGIRAIGFVQSTFHNEQFFDLTLTVSQNAKLEFEQKLAGITIAIAELVDDESSIEKIKASTPLINIISSYHEELKRRGIKSHFSKEFLHMLMVARLENGK